MWVRVTCLFFFCARVQAVLGAMFYRARLNGGGGVDMVG